MEETKRKRSLSDYIFLLGYISGGVYFYHEFKLRDKKLKKEESIQARIEKIEALKQYALELVQKEKGGNK